MFEHLSSFFVRLRYPGSMPQDIAEALGVAFSNKEPFLEFVHRLEDCCPTRLRRFMPREEAEGAFANALKKERFRNCCHFSYYFDEGWLEFVLHFDQEGRLRRLYAYHRAITEDDGIEVHLS